MEWNFALPSSTTRELRLVSSLVWGGTRLYFRGREVPASREERGAFLVTRPDGSVARVQVRSRVLDAVPQVTIDGMRVELARPLSTLETVICALPIGLMSVGGALGGGIGAAAAWANTRIVRAADSAAARWLGVLATTGCAFLVWLVAVSMLLGRRDFASGTRWAEPREEVAGSTEPIPPLPPALRQVEDTLFRAVTPAPDPFGYPANTVDRRAVLVQLRAHRLDELEAQLRAWRDSTNADIRYEHHLRDAYLAFRQPDPALQAPIEGWLRERPGSPEAAFAAASYYTARAARARGGDVITNTSDSQRVLMANWATAAVEQARAGLRADPANLVGYAILLDVLQFRGWSRKYAAVLEEGLRVHPTSYALRARAMYTLAPRWGGSLTLMTRYARDGAKLASQNPRLRALLGFPDAERAHIHRLSKDYAGAVYYYTRALRHGADWEFLLGRGKAYFYAGDYARALEDLVRAAQQRPQSQEVNEMLGLTLLNLAKALPPEIRGTALDRAIADLEFVRDLDPSNADIGRWLAHGQALKRACLEGPTPCR